MSHSWRSRSYDRVEAFVNVKVSCISAMKCTAFLLRLGQHLVDGFGGGQFAFGAPEGFGREGVGAAEFGEEDGGCC
jgi:hypothetical protein